MSGLLLRDPRNPTYGLLHSRLQQETTDAELQLVTVVPSVAQRAEFAYVNAQAPGVMHVRAEYDGDTAVLTVTVTDEGVWRIEETGHKNPARGRGIPLMRALTDHAVIDSNHAGTEVRLQWRHIDQDCGSRTT